ncbi:hypothetical protein EV207_102167 [Scopulibacillus darangshiensis]|uniref:Uncharacterized protein n=1 Tax=Scopulibacillus darangshiensis TaxID=442528 RepID=A0A4R2P9S4_9BACL|nr:hypothetical protein [Scopulibacillus darangshiensis]TCP31677.1 hypothetical protein EV207_102167 [Scopulibacillus darangshiensis]
MEQENNQIQTEEFDQFPSRLDRHRKKGILRKRAKSQHEDEHSEKKTIKTPEFIFSNIILWAFIAMVSFILIFVISSYN